ncbi:MAG TPA: hypothetical protein VKB93_29340 [Thermoanaerobaculia bacterium]|nr:hypothetical protein [Thermoanaerobaculia bacterium]
MPESAPVWPFWQRFAFRFAFVYVLLFFFPLPSGLAGPEFLSGLFDPLWNRAIPWAGRTFLGLEITNFSNGSGDTLYDWVRIGTMAVLALLGAIVWSILDRRRPNYATLGGWAHLFLRYALAISMVTYGVSKVIKLQFPTPGYGRLTGTYGESSPMGLLWTFMGYSTAYTFIAGASELLAALLLFFRRTATAGAIVAAAVMTNIALLNFCYDVPVKIGSVHLLFAAVLLLIPDLRRLFNAVILGRATGPAPDLEPRPKRLAFGLKLLIMIAVLGSQFKQAIDYKRTVGDRSNPKPPDGWYAVSSLRRDGVELVPLATNGERWKTFVLLRGYVRLWGFDRSTRLFKVDGKPDSEFALLPTNDIGETPADAKPLARLRFQVAPDGNATLRGTFEEHQIEVAMKRENNTDFPLMKRGFHWVSEFPYNR